MKKIKFICFLLFVSIAAIAQTPFPSISKKGSASTLEKSLGGIKADSLFINAVYLDTTAANRNPYNKTYIGGQIYTTSDSSIWLWQGKWIKAKGGSGGGSPYTITKNATRDTIILSDGSNITKIKDSVGVPQNLQQVTDLGATTTIPITIQGIDITNNGSTSNSIIGYLNTNFTGSNATVLGSRSAINSAVTGLVAIGVRAAESTSGDNLLAVGLRSGIYNTGSNNTFLGNSASSNNTSNNTTIIGQSASFGNSFSNTIGIATGLSYINFTGNNQIIFKPGIFQQKHILNGYNADRNITWQDADGTVAYLTDVTAGVNFYNTNGTLTSPRRVNGNGYLLKFDSTKVSFSDTSNIAGHLYDFNNGVSFVDYNSTNTSSLIQTEISGVKFSTNDRNNLDTSNYLWAKTDKIELFSTNRIDINSRTFYPATYTTAGTTGNQTINKNSGSVNIAPAITTITVTNNLVTANTIVTARVSSNDATAEILNVVSVTNGFIITMSTPATNEAQIKFWITN